MRFTLILAATALVAQAQQLPEEMLSELELMAIAEHEEELDLAY